MPCFNTLAMGYSWAVEFAQPAHQRLLARAGLRPTAERVAPQLHLPRGRILDLLQIDDHIILHAVPQGTVVSERGEQVLGLSSAAHLQAGLPVNAGKQQRSKQGGIALGAFVSYDG